MMDMEDGMVYLPGDIEILKSPKHIRKWVAEILKQNAAVLAMNKEVLSQIAPPRFITRQKETE